MMLTILNPKEVRSTFSLSLIPHGGWLSDYIQVSAIDVHGTWEMADCMSAESRAKLARWANEEERRVKNERARRRHASESA